MNMAASDVDKESLPKCVVIIPANNEAADVASVIGEVQKYSSFPVVVVDDASTDDTASRARNAGATVIPLAIQLGAWGATQTGLRYAQAQNFDYAITMDADGQHEAESLPDLMQPILEGEADVAIGACTQRGSVSRRIAWAIMKKISGLSHADLTSGFRVYDRQAIDSLASRQATLLEYQDVGVLFLLRDKGLRIKDIEVKMSPRINGISRIFYSWLAVSYYMAYTLLLSFSKRGMSRQSARLRPKMPASLRIDT
jgi:glycosyltransferase involved in cell wall biosynthesis